MRQRSDISTISSESMRPGTITAGSFPATPSFAKKPLASWTCTKAGGRESRWLRSIACCARTRKLVFKRAAVALPPSRRVQVDRCGWSMNMNDCEPGPIWRPGTYGEPASLAVVSQKPGSNPSVDSSPRSWPGSLIARRPGSSGYSTTALRIGGRPACADSRVVGATSSWCTRRCMPAG